jgi:hypothetical protein
MSCASSSGFWISWMLMKTSRFVFFWISVFSLSTSGALAADDDARPRGVDVDLQLVGRALDLDLRDTRVREALFSVSRSFRSSVQQLRVVLVGVPARAPGLVEAEPKSVRMNFLTHSKPSPLLVLPRGLRFDGARFLAALPGFAFGFAPRGRFARRLTGRRRHDLRRRAPPPRRSGAPSA